MLDYVVKMTKDATKCSPTDHARLRQVGFDDRGILQITLITAWFNYINRVADALGVGRDLPNAASFANDSGVKANQANQQEPMPSR